jgi:methionine sulfoxide reductase heme-binding subunit
MKGFYRFVGSRRFSIPLIIGPFLYLSWVFYSTQHGESKNRPEAEEKIETEEFDTSLFTVTDEEFQQATSKADSGTQQDLVVNLHEKITDDTGNIAIAYFIWVLCLTPLKILLRRNKFISALNRHRRTVGLACFFYAMLHLAIYLTNGLKTLWDEITRLYIAAGFSAFAILLVMALTSNNWIQRKIGGRKWKKLHRIVYIAIPILIYHRSFAGKVSAETIRESFIWFSPLIILQILRIWKQIKEQKARA